MNPTDTRLTPTPADLELAAEFRVAFARALRVADRDHQEHALAVAFAGQRRPRYEGSRGELCDRLTLLLDGYQAAADDQHIVGNTDMSDLMRDVRDELLRLRP